MDLSQSLHWSERVLMWGTKTKEVQLQRQTCHGAALVDLDLSKCRLSSDADCFVLVCDQSLGGRASWKCAELSGLGSRPQYSQTPAVCHAMIALLTARTAFLHGANLAQSRRVCDGLINADLVAHGLDCCKSCTRAIEVRIFRAQIFPMQEIRRCLI